MDFQLSDDQLALRETAQRFAREKLVEEAKQIEETGNPVSEEMTKQFAQLGFLGINLDPQYGGLGLSFRCCYCS